jgi:cobalamin biosynthesis protein CobD/CbiB
MAWDNRKIEPRREWTEQTIGFVIFSVLVVADYFVSALIQQHSHEHIPFILTMVLVAVFFAATMLLATIALYATWHLIHEIGEVACGVLRAINLDPRPKQRFRR